MNLNQKLKIAKSLTKSRLLNNQEPLILSWEIISICNFKCSYCGFGDPEFAKSFKQLSVDEVLSVIKLFRGKNVGVVSLTGGEPLLFKGIENVIAEMKSNSWTVKLGSNGSLINERYELIKDVDQISISLDGLEKENDSSRGVGTFDKTMTGIEKLKIENKSFYLNVTVTKNNYSSMKEIIKLCEVIDTRCFFQPATENILFKKEENQERCSPEEFHLAISSLMELKREYPKRIINSLKGLEFLKGWPEPKSIPCYSGINTFRIDSESNMWNCGRNKVSSINLLELFNTGKDLSFPDHHPCQNCWCAGLVEHNFFMQNPLSNLGDIIERIL